MDPLQKFMLQVFGIAFAVLTWNLWNLAIKLWPVTHNIAFCGMWALMGTACGVITLTIIRRLWRVRKKNV